MPVGFGGLVCLRSCLAIKKHYSGLGCNRGVFSFANHRDGRHERENFNNLPKGN